MKNLVFIAAATAAFVLPQTASAQALPAAVIAVADINRASAQCNACRTAVATLEGQVNSLKALQTSLVSQLASAQALQASLGASLQTEGKALQPAVDALKGGKPDAALTARIQAFQAKQQSAQQQLAQRQETIQANQQYVVSQINTKLDPAISSVMARRGANLVLDMNATIKSAPSIDINSDVLAAVNATLPSVSTTAPARAATPQSR